ncbi:hypothetical protein NQZ68_018680, partial [Dissostichus eleginoides]
MSHCGNPFILVHWSHRDTKAIPEPWPWPQLGPTQQQATTSQWSPGSHSHSGATIDPATPCLADYFAPAPCFRDTMAVKGTDASVTGFSLQAAVRHGSCHRKRLEDSLWPKHRNFHLVEDASLSLPLSEHSLH